MRICICLPLLPNNFVYFLFSFLLLLSFLLFSFSLSRDILWKKTVICLSITSLGIRVHVNIKSNSFCFPILCSSYVHHHESNHLNVNPKFLDKGSRSLLEFEFLTDLSRYLQLLFIALIKNLRLFN